MWMAAANGIIRFVELIRTLSGDVRQMAGQYAAMVATVVLVAGICFQLLLAAGLPWGRAAYGGQHSGVLPTKLRVSSVAAAVILGIAAWIVLARAGLVAPHAASIAIRIATWVFGGFFCLNTLGNLASKSALERKIMTPQTVVLAACFFLVALA
jgi:hypothetical protein